MATHSTERDKERKIDKYNRFGSTGQWAAAFTVGATSATTTFVNLVRNKFRKDSGVRPGYSAIESVKDDALANLNAEHFHQTTNFYRTFLTEPGKPDKSAWLDNYVEARGKLSKALIKVDGDKKRISSTELEDLNSALENTMKDFYRECAEEIKVVHADPAFKKLGIEYGKALSAKKSYYEGLKDSIGENFYGLKSVGFKKYTLGIWERFRSYSNPSKGEILWKAGAALAAGFGVTMMAFNQLNNRDKLNELDKAAGTTNEKLDKIVARLDGLPDPDKVKATPRAKDANAKAAREYAAMAREQQISEEEVRKHKNLPHMPRARDVNAKAEADALREHAQAANDDAAMDTGTHHARDIIPRGGHVQAAVRERTSQEHQEAAIG